MFQESLMEFFAPIAPFLEDPSITEIMINGPGSILVERGGVIERTRARFPTTAALDAALRNLAQYVGRRLDERSPILEGRLPDGSRVQAIVPPVSPDGPHVAIRRFSRHTLSMERLVSMGALSEDASAFLEQCVLAKRNILISGGTGSGKTSLLNALSAHIPDGVRVIVIEDARELQLMKPDVVSLEARPADEQGGGGVSIRDLFHASLRLRPDRIVVGEIRGGEALDLIQAMISGHGGCLSTVHASSPMDALSRIETLALMNKIDLPLFALRSQVASAIDLVVQTARLEDGKRGITHITGATGYDHERGYVLDDFFVRRRDAAATGLVSTDAMAAYARGLCAGETQEEV